MCEAYLFHYMMRHAHNIYTEAYVELSAIWARQFDYRQIRIAPVDLR